MKTPVYFYVQRKNATNQTLKGDLKFDIEVVNIGGAMDLKTGVFTAPRNGTYYFIFSALMKFPNNASTECYIYLWGRGTNRASTFFRSNDSVPVSSTLHASVHLKQGDQVKLKIYVTNHNSKVELWDTDSYHYTHFSGGLLQEDV